MSEYPELNKLEERQNEAVVIGRFLQWVRSGGWVLCTENERYNDPYSEIGQSDLQVICSYLNLDAAKVEQERRAMVAELMQSAPKVVQWMQETK